MCKHTRFRIIVLTVVFVSCGLCGPCLAGSSSQARAFGAFDRGIRDATARSNSLQTKLNTLQQKADDAEQRSAAHETAAKSKRTELESLRTELLSIEQRLLSGACPPDQNWERLNAKIKGNAIGMTSIRAAIVQQADDKPQLAKINEQIVAIREAIRDASANGRHQAASALASQLTSLLAKYDEQVTALARTNSEYRRLETEQGALKQVRDAIQADFKKARAKNPKCAEFDRQIVATNTQVNQVQKQYLAARKEYHGYTRQINSIKKQQNVLLARVDNLKFERNKLLGNPGNPGNSGNPGNAGGRSNPGNAGNPGGRSNPGNKGNPGGRSNPGNKGNPGNSGEIAR